MESKRRVELLIYKVALRDFALNTMPNNGTVYGYGVKEIDKLIDYLLDKAADKIGG